MHDGCWPNTSRTIMKIALTTPWRRNRRCVGPSPSVPLHNRRSLGFPEWAVCITATNGHRQLEPGLAIVRTWASHDRHRHHQAHASRIEADLAHGRHARVRDVTTSER